MYYIRDGYITGALSPHAKKCPLCGEQGRVIDVADFQTPRTFRAPATIMWSRATEGVHTAIGLTCGCYAKLHRQIAHINDIRMQAGHAV
jgi:ribosomal protein RSM22 (predicted rRNA methylase)